MFLNISFGRGPPNLCSHCYLQKEVTLLLQCLFGLMNTWYFINRANLVHNLFLVYLSISTCFVRWCAHHQEKICVYVTLGTCYSVWMTPVEMWWHTVTHGRGSEGETGEWSGQPVPFTLPRSMVYPALLPLMRTPRLPVVDWTDAPADLNGLVRPAERRNLVSAHVPSHFNWSLPM